MNTPPELLDAAATLVGWLLVHSLWQGACIALALRCALALFRTCSAAIRHACCVAALAAMVASTAGTAWILKPIERSVPVPEAPFVTSELSFAAPPPIVQVENGVALDQPMLQPGAPPVPALPPAAASLTDRLETALPWLAGIWFAGVSLLSLRHVGGSLQVRALRQSSIHPSPALLGRN